MKEHLKDALIDELAEAGPEAALDEEVALHLADCPTCREELQLARLVTVALDSVPRMTAPPALFEGVMAAVSQKTRRQQRRALVFSAMGALMALAVVILWLVAGGAASLALEALETFRSVEMVTRIASSVWRTIPMELFILCTVVLLGSSAALSRLVARMGRSTNATAEAG